MPLFYMAKVEKYVKKALLKKDETAASKVEAALF